MHYSFARVLLISIVITSTLAIEYACDNKKVPCGCGYRSVELSPSRIVGGEEAVAYSWSMIVSLRIRPENTHFCGGSILSDSYILTAAHCVDSITADRLAITAGIHNKSEDYPTIRFVETIHIHPGWSSSSLERRNDIAILKLTTPLNFEADHFVKRTCIPDSKSIAEIVEYPRNRTRLAIAGWGHTRMGDSSSSPDILQQAEVFLIHHTERNCNRSLYDIEKQFCAALDEGGKDTCQGDSGGPIFQWLEDRWEQVGITSFGTGCALPGEPGIYTRLAYYTEWIESIISSSIDTTTPEPPIPSQPPTRYGCDHSTAPCGCGYDDVEITPSKIVGGENAVPYSWSMMVSLQRYSNQDHFCGGTILSESYILTAAHCVDDLKPDDVYIATGIHRLSESTVRVRYVDEIHVHPNWSPASREFRNDIALLHISEPFDFSSDPFIRRTCIPNLQFSTGVVNYPRNRTRLAIAGWGAKRMGDGSTPDILQQAEVFLIHHTEQNCNRSLYDIEKQFCAALDEGGKDTCQGDSGGPIFQWLGNRWEQVGITSFGKGCALRGEPGVYTRLAYYTEWIKSTMNRTTHQTSTTSTRWPPITDGARNSRSIAAVELVLLLASLIGRFC